VLNFAANLSFLFGELPFSQRFAAAAKAGFKAVEFLFPYDFEPREISTLIEDAKLTLALFNMPPGNWGKGERGLAAVPGQEMRFKTTVETALPYLLETGLKQIHVMAGCVEPNERDSAKDVYMENLSQAAKRLNEEGINLLIEPINTTDMPGYFLNNVETAVDIIRTVGAPNLKLQFDCYHRAMMGDDVILGLKDNFSNIAHIQIAGMPDRHEPDDYSEVFATLQELGYGGWIGCEYKPRTKTIDGLGWRPI